MPVLSCLPEEGELAFLSIQPTLTQHLLSTYCLQASVNETVEGLTLPSSKDSASWPVGSLNSPWGQDAVAIPLTWSGWVFGGSGL